MLKFVQYVIMEHAFKKHENSKRCLRYKKSNDKLNKQDNLSK